MPLLDVRVICGGTRVSRADGEKLRRAIEGEWDTGEVIEVDFGAVPIASVSFLDESFGMLAKRFSLETMKHRLRMTRISEPDRLLLNSILASRARERDSHLWRGMLAGTEWVADVLWDDGTLLGLRIAPTMGSNATVENAWWDYQAESFADWKVDAAPTELRADIGRALARRELAVRHARDRLLQAAGFAAGSSGSASTEQLVTVELETQEDVDAARRLAREGKAMVTGRSCVIRVTPSAAE